ncbi:MAG: DUF262 domain-containing protein, partial [Alphaproteobacteria bacterium]|nr:DUF262 domain-containing protein [Alphaproteobacteria bacterium]
MSGLFDGGVAFYIPRYQRPFAWTKDQWGELFSDIGENDQGYFLGSIICINKHHDAHDIQRLEVVDGQQRLITLSLLFASMYDFLQSRKDSLNEDQRADIVNLKLSLIHI